MFIQTKATSERKTSGLLRSIRWISDYRNIKTDRAAVKRQGRGEIYKDQEVCHLLQLMYFFIRSLHKERL